MIFAYPCFNNILCVSKHLDFRCNLCCSVDAVYAGLVLQRRISIFVNCVVPVFYVCFFAVTHLMCFSLVLYSVNCLLHYGLVQGFPTWGTYNPRGTFAYLKGYI